MILYTGGHETSYSFIDLVNKELHDGTLYFIKFSGGTILVIHNYLQGLCRVFAKY